MRRLRVLLLADDFAGHADTVLEHIRALTELSEHDVRLYNCRGVARSRFLRLREFDVVVLHYSVVCISDHYLSPWFREQIARFEGLKIQFLQDEYRWVDRITATIREMGVSVLFSCLPADEAERIYGGRLPGVRVVPTLTGYVSDALAGVTPRALKDRPIDIGYRSRELPFWLGDLAQDKVRIARGVRDRASRLGLNVDIAWTERDRVYGRAWTEFLSSCRATLGTGSGASIADFDGSVEVAVKEYLARQPDAGYDEVHAAVLAPYEGNVRFDVVSPRVFEAAALRTALVQFPGDYSGVLQPWEHYIPLERDFSNIEEVAQLVRDDRFLDALTGRVHEAVIASGRYSFRRLAADFDAVLGMSGWSMATGTAIGYQAARLSRAVDLSEVTRRVPRRIVARLASRTGSQFLQRLGSDPRAYLTKGWQAMAAVGRRPAARRAVRAWLSDHDVRSQIRADEMLEDLLELDIAIQLAREGRLAISHDVGSGRLLLRTVAEAPLPAAAPVPPVGPPVVGVRWDHRSAGGQAAGVAIGNQGISDFGTLAALAGIRPELVAELVAPLLAAAPAGPSATITRRSRRHDDGRSARSV